MDEPSALNGTPPPASAGAFELKVDLPPERAAEVAEWARARLVPDTHAEADGLYHVHSVYFDTPTLDVFHRREGFREFKYRVRRYGSQDHVFLEEKRRVEGFVTKRRSAVDLAQLEAALGARAENWYVEKLRAKALAPVCAVAYERLALVGASSGQTVRVTLDRQLVAAPLGRVGFAPWPPADATPIAHTILELKFPSSLPVLCKELLAHFRLAPGTVSKYRLAQVVLGRVDAPANR